MVRVSRSVFPLDWDRNCSDKAFNDWQVYIREELKKMVYPEKPIEKVQRQVSQEDAIGQIKVLLQAKKILRK